MEISKPTFIQTAGFESGDQSLDAQRVYGLRSFRHDELPVKFPNVNDK